MTREKAWQLLKEGKKLEFRGTSFSVDNDLWYDVDAITRWFDHIESWYKIVWSEVNVCN